jgi:hypothetical protein
VVDIFEIVAGVSKKNVGVLVVFLDVDPDYIQFAKVKIDFCRLFCNQSNLCAFGLILEEES